MCSETLKPLQKHDLSDYPYNVYIKNYKKVLICFLSIELTDMQRVCLHCNPLVICSRINKET